MNGTSSILIFDNSNENSESATCTPFPGDLNGVQLSQLNISRKACVDLRQAKSNNDVRSYGFDLDASSKVTGDSVTIDTSNASVRGSITGSTTVWLKGSEVTLQGSIISTGTCEIKGLERLTHSGNMAVTGSLLLKGSDVTLQGSISAGTGEIKGLERLTHSGSLVVSGSLLSIEASTASISGTVRCSGSACSSLVSVNRTLEMGGSLSCTVGKCSLSLRSGGDMNSSGTVSCSGNSQCLVEVASGSSAVLSGSMTGSDIRMVVAEALRLLGTVSTSGQGYAERSGDRKGNQPTYTYSSTSNYRVSGSGAGHGGNGAAACYRYRSGYGSIPSGTIWYCIITITHVHACFCNQGPDDSEPSVLNQVARATEAAVCLGRLGAEGVGVATTIAAAASMGEEEAVEAGYT